MAEVKIITTEDLKRRFKSACAEKGETMSDIAVKLFEGWLEGQYVLPEVDKTKDKT